jgi:hypothetical protein
MIIYKLYKNLNNETGVMVTKENGNMVSFLLDKNNPEQEIYDKWLEEGNTPLPAEENN